MSQKIEIINVMPYGYMVKNISRNIRQFIPKELMLKRIKWGLYEVINKSKFSLG
jgi:hypothetical protein